MADALRIHRYYDALQWLYAGERILGADLLQLSRLLHGEELLPSRRYGLDDAAVLDSVVFTAARLADAISPCDNGRSHCEAMVLALAWRSRRDDPNWGPWLRAIVAETGMKADLAAGLKIEPEPRVIDPAFAAEAAELVQQLEDE